jgi:hypothetical protein
VPSARIVDAFLAAHHGIISRAQAQDLGLTEEQINRALRSGRWASLHRGVYRRAGEPAGPQARLYAACLAAGPSAVASHASAAWLWELGPGPPSRPCVTVALSRSARLQGVDQHRRNDVDYERVLVRLGIPVTDPIRTLADLGAGAAAAELDDAVDRALARRLVTVEGLEHEVGRLARRGRRGVPQLRTALERRGFATVPSPSVLESRLLRRLHGWGITPAGIEVVAGGGRYRLDVLLCPGVALEVDGYAYHSSPEAKAADSHRRNELRLAGIVVIEADWVTLHRHPERLHASVVAAMALARPQAAGGAIDPAPAKGPRR